MVAPNPDKPAERPEDQPLLDKLSLAIPYVLTFLLYLGAVFAL